MITSLCTLIMIVCIYLISACSTQPTSKFTMQPYAAIPDEPYRTDGCTLVPDFNFRTCCEAHDRAYWCGGTKAQRLMADHDFKQCMIDYDHPILARLYYRGVRASAVPWLPTYWRWGFGWKKSFGYTESPLICLDP